MNLFLGCFKSCKRPMVGLSGIIFKNGAPQEYLHCRSPRVLSMSEQLPLDVFFNPQ